MPSKAAATPLPRPKQTLPIMSKTLFSCLLVLSSLPGLAQTESTAPARPKSPAVAPTPPAPAKLAAALPASPRQLFPGLFEAVQLGRIFPDNKTFVDAAPQQRPATILAAWRREKSQPGFQLKAFVEAHFTMPTSGAVPFETDVKAGLRHRFAG
jgi:alpha,alpha-trehalase